MCPDGSDVSATAASAPAPQTRPPATEALAGSALANLTALPLLPADTVTSFGPTLVLAPHPDDETLACGGLLALLAARGIPVAVLVLTDGRASHIGSRRYPPAALDALRKCELLAAVAQLGLPANAVTWLDMPDAHAPTLAKSTPEAFAAGVTQLVAALRALPFRPQTIWAPWQREPHTDHRAAWELLQAALASDALADWQPRVIAWPLWVLHIPKPGDPPLPDEVNVWRLDISDALPQKQAAIAEYVSQVTALIDDADKPWHLPAAVLAFHTQPWELGIDVLEDAR